MFNNHEYCWKYKGLVEFQLLFYFRCSEFLTLISLSTTFFLFLHTRDLSVQLSQERLRHNNDVDVADNEVETGDDHFHSRDLNTAIATGADPIIYSQVTDKNIVMN